MEQVEQLLHALGWERDLAIMQVVLPVGISFFTFQGMSYVIDIYRRKTAPATLLDMILLMSFFPHLVAGPIVRASHLIPQFSEGAGARPARMAAMGIALIVWGLFKKAVIASELATGLVDHGLLRSRRAWQPRPDRRRLRLCGPDLLRFLRL